MNRQFVVTLSLGNAAASQTLVWDTARPHRVGQSLPWKLECKAGRVVLRHASGKKFEVRPEQLESDTYLKLPHVEGDRTTPAQAQLRFRQVRDLPSLLKGETGLMPAGGSSGELMVSLGVGGLGRPSWVIESGTLESSFAGKYVARAEKQHVFTLSRKGDTYEIKPKASNAIWSGAPLASVQSFTTQALLNNSNDATVTWGRYVWRFTVVPTTRLEIPERTDSDVEAQWFRRAMTGVVLGLGMVFLLISIFGERAAVQEEKKDTGTFAKIVIKPRPRPLSQPAASTPAASAPKPSVTKVEAPKAVAKEIVKVAPRVVPPPPVPVPPKVAPAVLAAQKLQKSMSALLPGGMTSLLKETTIAKGTNGERQSSMLTGRSDAINSAAPTQGLAQQDSVNVAVAEGGASGSANYRWAAPGAKGDGSGSGKFLSIGAGDESGSGSLVEDGLSKREVWEVINRHFSEIRNCYESAIVRKADIEGKLMVQFSIDSGGHVRKASVKASTLKDPRLDQCILGRLTQWAFPKPKGRSEVSVTYPFLFKRL